MSKLSLIGQIEKNRCDKTIITSEHKNDISSKVIDILSLDGWSNNNNRLLAISWLAWSGKWGISRLVANKMDVKLKEKILNDKWDIKKIKLWLKQSYNNHDILYMWLDYFFKWLWTLRHNEMLESSEKFLELFSDDDKALEFISKYLSTKTKFEFEEIYTSRQKEKDLGKPLGKFVVNKKVADNSLVILDWVHSFLFADELVSKWIYLENDITKLMVLPRLDLAFQRIIKRDHIIKGKDLATIIRFRLIESFFLFKEFFLKSINQENIVFVDFSPLNDYELDIDVINKVIDLLVTIREELLNNYPLVNNSQKIDFEIYLNDYVDLLLASFESINKKL